MSTPPLPGTTWRHFKGFVCVVVAIARHSETLEWMVVYKKKDSPEGENTWVRPLSMWEELVNVQGKQTPRFTRI